MRQVHEPYNKLTLNLQKQSFSAYFTLLAKKLHLSAQQLIIIPQILILTPKQLDLMIQMLYLFALLAHKALDEPHAFLVAAAEALLLFRGGLRRKGEDLAVFRMHINRIIYFGGSLILILSRIQYA